MICPSACKALTGYTPFSEEALTFQCSHSLRVRAASALSKTKRGGSREPPRFCCSRRGPNYQTSFMPSSTLRRPPRSNQWKNKSEGAEMLPRFWHDLDGSRFTS